MANSSDMGLISLPLALAIFAALLNDGTALSVFASIGALAAAVAVTAVLATVGGIQIFGSGVEIKDFSLKLTFVTTFLTVFYTSNILIGLNLILAVPLGLGLIIFGLLTTLFVLGMFGMVSGS
jgi:hypothetical protein